MDVLFILWISQCVPLGFKLVLKIASRAWEDYRRMLLITKKKKPLWRIEESNVDFGRTWLRFEQHFQTWYWKRENNNYEIIFIWTSASERSSFIRIWTKKGHTIQKKARFFVFFGRDMRICLLMSLTDWSPVNIKCQQGKDTFILTPQNLTEIRWYSRAEVTVY